MIFERYKKDFICCNFLYFLYAFWLKTMLLPGCVQPRNRVQLLFTRCFYRCFPFPNPKTNLYRALQTPVAQVRVSSGPHITKKCILDMTLLLPGCVTPRNLVQILFAWCSISNPKKAPVPCVTKTGTLLRNNSIVRPMISWHLIQFEIVPS